MAKTVPIHTSTTELLSRLDSSHAAHVPISSAPPYENAAVAQIRREDITPRERVNNLANMEGACEGSNKKRARDSDAEADVGVIVLVMMSTEGDVYGYTAPGDLCSETEMQALNMSTPSGRAGCVPGFFQDGAINESEWTSLPQAQLPSVRNVKRVVSAWFDE